MNKFFRLAIIATTIACSREKTTLFVKHEAESSGVEFINLIDNSDSLNILNYLYYYDGGGVGAGDFNNDGLIDLFFAGSRVNDALYFNQGNWKFTDVTKKAGINRHGWSTGVSVVDINADGWLDIYVSRAGFSTQSLRENVLYLNQKDGTFREQAAIFGIHDDAYTTHSAFFDFDRDGDLDLYVMNHANDRSRVNTPIQLNKDGNSASADHLYRNEQGKFINVSKDSGILAEGYGLGLVINDFNHDGWPDIYVANDFIFSDLLYINNRDGTFTEKADRFFAHQSYNSMGADVGDINNDGRMDLITLDMLPEGNYRQKTMMGAMNYDKFQRIISSGYAPQYMRNMLQVDMGNGIFSEIGRYAGIDATDWSWAPLIADFDNDGMNDVFISNGYYKDITNKDFIAYSQSISMFKSGPEADSAVLAALEDLREVKLPNYMFRNTGNFNFENESSKWLGTTPSLSNGAIYADLDHDGDLDLVMNNLNEAAGIFENTLEDHESHYLKVTLKGHTRTSIGAQIRVYVDDEVMIRNWNPYKGYLSSTYDAIHFGLGSHTLVDSLVIQWAQGGSSTLMRLPTDTLLIIHKPELLLQPLPVYFTKNESLIPGLDFVHQEDEMIDFDDQPLLPKMLSKEGPALVIGDLNSDLLEDVYVGGAFGQAGELFIQTGHGFSKIELEGSEAYEDVDAVIIDANGDGLNDLFVVSGGNNPDHSRQDRLYLNVGDNKWRHAPDWLPVSESNGSTVSAADLDKDGDLDLFIGAGNIPANYPMSDESYILINQGDRFLVATANASWLSQLGIIADSKWADLDGNGWPDLILSGAWMPLTIVYNESGQLSPPIIIPNSEGWWNALQLADLDNDGDVDIVAGNYGTNSEYKADVARPVTIVAKDFDNNGSIDPIISRYFDEVSYPVATRDALISQIPALQGRLPKYAMYGQSKIEDIFTDNELKGIFTLEIHELRSGIFENTGSAFQFHPLPDVAQFGPVNSILCEDIDDDGIVEIIVVGNDHGIEVLGGQQDALPGLVMKKSKDWEYKVKRLFEASDARKIRSIEIGEQKFWLIARNSNRLKIIEK